ncbi:hypothetical protein OAJ20_02230 [Candidatus Pelagibacter sp.]|nr:hypothetical protein [Candidatus Pelagibacter sp.]
MKKLLALVVLSLMICGNAYSKIVFWAVCENPKGVRNSESILHLDNDKIISTKYKEDQFPGSDTIELIYYDNRPNEIQFIWGAEKKNEKLYAQNENFFHWGFIDNNFSNGFYWGHWSFSLPNKMLTYYKGNTNSDGISTGIATSIFSSKCIIK